MRSLVSSLPWSARSALWVGLLTLASVGAARAEGVNEVLYLARNADSLRFAAESTPGPSFPAGTRVTVLLRAESQVRVFAGDKFGWVPADALTATAPASAPSMAPPGLPPIQLEGFTPPKP